MGQAGAYILTDPAEESLGLPSGYGVYDIPLIRSSKQYNEDGSVLHKPAASDWSSTGQPAVRAVIFITGFEPLPFVENKALYYPLSYARSVQQ